MRGKEQTVKKSYELFYDDLSQRYVLEIIDTDSLFPLLIKVKSIEPRVLKFSQNKKLLLN